MKCQIFPLRLCFLAALKKTRTVVLFISEHLNNSFDARSCAAVKPQCETCPGAGAHGDRWPSLGQTMEPLQRRASAPPPTAPHYSVPALSQSRFAASPRQGCASLNQHMVWIKHREVTAAGCCICFFFFFLCFLMGRKVRLVLCVRLVGDLLTPRSVPSSSPHL